METAFVPIKKVDARQQIVYGEVYVPNMLDSHGDFMTPEQVEKMAHNFMRRGLVRAVDTEHDLQENGSTIVESFVARGGDPDFVEGAWVAAVHVQDPQLWAMIERGDINGFSMFGKARQQERVLEIEIPDDGVVKGETAEGGEPVHTHRYELRFDDGGNFLGGEAVGTDHTHRISHGTSTDTADGHSHRFSFLEALT